MADLAERLRKLLKESGLSPRAAALAAGIDPSNLYRLLEGERRRPSNETLARLAGVLGIGVDELTGTAEPALLAAAGAQRLARLAITLDDIDLEAHLRTLGSLSAQGRADCVAYARWRAQREQTEEPARPRDFQMTPLEPEAVRVLGETPPVQPGERNAS